MTKLQRDKSQSENGLQHYLDMQLEYFENMNKPKLPKGGRKQDGHEKQLADHGILRFY